MAIGAVGLLGRIVAPLAVLALVVPLGWMWWDSRLPNAYSVMDMGYVDLGGGPGAHDHAHAAEEAAVVDVDTLTGPRRGDPDVAETLTAERGDIDLAGGPTVAGYTLDGGSPGPTIRATEGDLVEVRLVNKSVPDGITLHWHGVDIVNAEDGVAGVTQDAVRMGAEYVYRFVVEDPGTYWYHSHQMSHEQVRGGLWGVLVVEPGNVTAAEPDLDLVAAVHDYDGNDTINGRVGETRVDLDAGATARVRVVNTDNSPMLAWAAGAPYRVASVDGRDLNEPTDVEDTAVLVAAGGRVDLDLQLPTDGTAVLVGVGKGSTSLVLGPPGGEAPGTQAPDAELDLLSYGTPAPAPFDTSRPDRTFDYRIGRRPGFLDGRPGLWWTINGHLYPDVPMFTVAEGDVVVMTLENTSGQTHPMHLHGHHALVLTRNGEPSTGSPWWVDSLDVADGETYEIAFLADNPGVWMDHCHNLPHATQGLVTHLVYEGVDTPFMVGGNSNNEPE